MKIDRPNWHELNNHEALERAKNNWPRFATVPNIGLRSDGIAYLAQASASDPVYAIHTNGNRTKCDHSMEFYTQWGYNIRIVTPIYAAALLAHLASQEK